MRLKLLHGRYDPAEQMDDWGFDGGWVDGVAWAHGTYTTHYLIGFKTDEAAEKAKKRFGFAEWQKAEGGDSAVLEVPFTDDMLQAPGFRFYGDGRADDVPRPAYFGDWEWQEDDAKEVAINET